MRTGIRVVAASSGLAVASLAAVALFPAGSPPAAPRPRSPRLGVPFVENVGQWPDPHVRFSAPIPGGRLVVTSSGELMYALAGGAFRERLGGRAVHPRGAVASAVRVNHLGPAGQGPVPAYAEVSLGQVTPGIEASLRAAAGNVEKIFRVRPGADPSALRIATAGAELSVASDGALAVDGAAGRVRFSAPVAYQEGPAGRSAVAVAYRTGGATYGFAVGDYDRGRELVIDPMLEARRIGGAGLDVVVDMAATESALYVLGTTLSADLPAEGGAHDGGLSGPSDAFVARLDGELSLVELTYLGGSGDETGHQLVIRADGRVVVAGTTSSDDFPIEGGAQPDFGGLEDSFVAVLEADLSAITASTYLGGSDWPDEVDALALGADGSVYAAGATTSPDWPVTPDAHDVTRDGVQDGFVTRLSADLSSITASTLLGGRNMDAVRALAVAVNGDVVVSGTTWSDDFPVTAGALETIWDGGSPEQGFVTRLGGDLGELVASTYLGGDSDAQVKSLAIRGDGAIAVAGEAYTASYPVTPRAFDSEFDGPSDAFVTFLEPDLGALVASTFLGGEGAMVLGEGVTLTAAGGALLVGRTYSARLPVLGDAADSESEGSEVFAVAFDEALEKVLEATYLGGAEEDVTWAPAVFLAGGKVAIAGGTKSDDFPGLGEGPGGEDGFIVVLDRLSGADPYDDPDGPILEVIAEMPALESVPLGHTTGTAISIWNRGAVDLAVDSIDLVGDGFSLDPGAPRPCPSFRPTIAPGDRCTMELSFSPVALGPATAAVIVEAGVHVAVAEVATTGVAGGEAPGEGGEDADRGCRAAGSSWPGCLLALVACAALRRRRAWSGDEERGRDAAHELERALGARAADAAEEEVEAPGAPLGRLGQEEPGPVAGQGERAEPVPALVLAADRAHGARRVFAEDREPAGVG